METAARKRYVFVDWLKVISMLMIVWDHLVAVRYPDMWIVQKVSEAVNNPLGLIQHFGALGVGIFLIVSGFLSARYWEQRISFRGFLNFWVKIYFGAVIAGVFFFGFNCFAELVWGPTWWSQYDAVQWIKYIFLVETIQRSSIQVNGTLWFMATLLFYRAIISLISMIPYKRVGIKIACVEVVLLINTIVVRMFGSSSNWGFLQERIPYVYIIVVGVLLKLYDEAKIGMKQAAFWQLLNGIMLIWSFAVFNIQSGYLVSVAYAVLLFLTFKAIDHMLGKNKVINLLSQASFAIYLLHATVGALLQSLFVDNLMIGHRNLAVVSALAVMVVVCLAYHHLIEKKYHALFDKLLKLHEKS